MQLLCQGVAGERIVSGEQRDTGEELPSTPESSPWRPLLLPQEITYFTQLRLHLSCRTWIDLQMDLESEYDQHEVSVAKIVSSAQEATFFYFASCCKQV